MTPLATPLTRDLVLIGGGHAHALVLRMWGMAPLAGARLTLIDPGATAPYTGMLPGHVAGHYSRDALEIDLVKLARFAGARLIFGAAEHIDPVARRITVSGRAEIAYDVASIDVGIHAQMPEIPGFQDHAIAVKPLGSFAERWAGFLDDAAAGQVPSEAAVIGGGVAGAELAMAMAHGLSQRTGRQADITLIERAAEVAPDAPNVRKPLLKALQAVGVRVLTGTEVARIDPDQLLTSDGTRIKSAFTAGAAGARAHGWLSDTQLPLTEGGFISVGADLQVTGHDTLFAAGDCAHLSHAPRPKAGVYAVRAAPVLHHNLRAALQGRPLRGFRPQKRYLKLISLGKKSALAERGRIALSGAALWAWKDRIDRRFIAKLNDLPDMAPPAPPRERALPEEALDPMLCGGCGSKVAPAALSDALSSLPASQRADVLAGPGDDAAILDVGGTRQVLTSDHLRAFTEDFGVLARIATLHAMGDIWAMGATPQAAVVSVVIPRMSEALQRRTMSEIMDAVHTVAVETEAEIVGGHSTMGAETTIGLSLTGLLDRAAITNDGAQDGDALILTRAVGSGTLLAAEMRRLAKGRDIEALFQVLQTAQGDAARILSCAHAMTDVTGFGLAGHLAAICRASGLGAEIDLAVVPVFEGAEALAAAGVRSTIWDANLRAAPVSGGRGARLALLHDPQTAGGFLAAVPSQDADGLVKQLRAAGHMAACIGRMASGPPDITVI